MAGAAITHLPLEPVGFLSSVFPGPVVYTGFEGGVAAQREDRSRLCEMVWLEPVLFNLGEGGAIYALDDEWYKIGSIPSVSSGETLATPPPGSPGSLGEQLSFRDMQHRHLEVESHLLIGDAVLQIVSLIPAPSTRRPVFAYELRIIEEGLVEPGSPIILK